MSNKSISQYLNLEPIPLRADDLNAEFNRLLEQGEDEPEKAYAFVAKSEMLIEELNTELAEATKIHGMGQASESTSIE